MSSSAGSLERVGDCGGAAGAARPRFLTDGALRLVFFGGKGGVGKTTCAAAAAVSMALGRPGERFLLISTDPAHSTSDCLGGRAGTLPANLELLEIDAGAEHAAFMAEHAETLREIAVRGTFLDEGDVDQFLKLSLPGIDELAAFLTIARLASAQEHACIVVDTAPTGHALRLLQMAGFMGSWLGAMDALLAKHRYMAGLFGRGTRRDDRCEAFIRTMQGTIDGLHALLTDRSRCRFVPVLLAEELSVLETGDLLKELASLGVRVEEAVVNRLVAGGESGHGLAMLRGAQRRVLAGLPLEVAKLDVWGQTLRGAEVIGAGALGEFFADTMAPTHLRAWIESGDVDAEDDRPGPRVCGGVELPASARLIVVAGKGGVGKTTTAASLAMALGERRGSGRVLVASTDPAHSLADALAMELGAEPTLVRGSVWAMELDARAEFETLASAYRLELEGMFAKMLEGADLAFDREVLERLLDLAPPGIDEVMALVRVVDLLAKADEGEGFASIVLDTAPSGHTLRLLGLPALIEAWLASIFRVLLKYQRVVRLPGLQKRLVELSRGVKRFSAMLKDGRTSCVVPVAIPTTLALEETRDLVGACRAAGIGVGCLVVNLITPEDEGSALSAAVVEREARTMRGFAEHLPGLTRAEVWRGRSPRGAEDLAALGRALAGGAAAARRAA
jgi:arsenite-transporting ATPase